MIGNSPTVAYPNFNPLLHYLGYFSGMARAKRLQRGSKSRLEPTSLPALVLKELMKIRLSPGLTHMRVRDFAPNIQNLRVVDDELLRRPTGTRSLAAYSVIKCAVVHEITDYTYRTALVRTLNLDGCGGKRYGSRKADLASLVSVSSTNSLDELCKASYEELASILVAAERSPCRVSGTISAQEVRQQVLSKLPESSVRIELPAELVREILTILAGALTPDSEQASATALLGFLPNLRPYLREHDLPNEKIYEVVGRINRDFYYYFVKLTHFRSDSRLALFKPDTRGDWLQHEFRVATLNYKSNRFRAFLSSAFLSIWPRTIHLMFFWLPATMQRIAGRLNTITETIEGRLKVHRKYWKSRKTYLNVLANIITTLERQNRWDVIFDRYQGSDIRITIE